MYDTVRTRRTFPIVLLLFLDILIASFLVFAVYFTVYEVPSAYPSDSTSTAGTPGSQTSNSSSLEEMTAEGIPGSQTFNSSSLVETTTATDWKIKFSDHFSGKIISTKTSYSSPNLSVDITKHTMGSLQIKSQGVRGKM